MSITIESALEMVTPAEHEYARQYYKADSASFATKMTASLGNRYGTSATADIVEALRVWCALAADQQ